MRRPPVGAALAVAAVLAACSLGQPAAAPSPEASAVPTPAAPPAAAADSLLAGCRTGAETRSLLLLSHRYQLLAAGGGLLYEVTDPLRPRLLCRIDGRSAHLYAAGTLAYLRPVTSRATDVVVRSLGSGSEVVAATLPLGAAYGVWLPDGSTMAFLNRRSDGVMEVWLYASQRLALLHTYAIGIGDCLCRFGIPPPTLAISADGRYLVSGWLNGKGSAPLRAFRIADRAQVQVFGTQVYGALWSRSGHRLFLLGSGPAQSWTPEAGAAELPGALVWSYPYLASLSPDGIQVAYTTEEPTQDPQQPQIFVYNLEDTTTTVLSQQPRSQVIFAKAGWVWYLEEASCRSNFGHCGPQGTAPTGRVLARDLASGREAEVNFAPGEEPGVADWNWARFAAGDLWPAG